jgi:hypothetical protein
VDAPSCDGAWGDESLRGAIRRTRRERVGRIESRFLACAWKPPARLGPRTSLSRARRLVEADPPRIERTRPKRSPSRSSVSQAFGSRRPAKAGVRNRRPRCVPPSRVVAFAKIAPRIGRVRPPSTRCARFNEEDERHLCDQEHEAPFAPTQTAQRDAPSDGVRLDRVGSRNVGSLSLPLRPRSARPQRPRRFL